MVFQQILLSNLFKKVPSLKLGTFFIPIYYLPTYINIKRKAPSRHLLIKEISQAESALLFIVNEG